MIYSTNQMYMSAPSYIEITHPISYRRVKISEFKVVYHDIPDAAGIVQNVKCVEFIIIGKNQSWVDWSFFADFVVVNPDLQLEE